MFNIFYNVNFGKQNASKIAKPNNKLVVIVKKTTLLKTYIKISSANF